MNGTVYLLDIDGTLVDSNYHHVVAWRRAFQRHELNVPAWRIHKVMGMGGDQLIAELAGDQVEREHGDSIREAWQQEFEPNLQYIEPFDGAHRLLADIVAAGGTVVLASSSKPHHAKHYVDLLDARDLATAWTDSGDVSDTKPSPELLHEGLSRVDGKRAVVIGDAVWDGVAARRAGLPFVGVLGGGYTDAELREAGAGQVYDGTEALRNDLADLPTAPINS
ncbi:HAD family hydrolase [Pseudonocardiaceae bacterium YIM PH 21723]|nr:HAD family hydrolase [Pseudonocardiaceae bacterium YIM PH 21723]